MSRFFIVYPKGILNGTMWEFIVEVYEHATRIKMEFVHFVPASLGISGNLIELKLGFDLVVNDADEPEAVFLALSDDDIRGGPQYETVIGNWIERAEANIVPPDPDADPPIPPMTQADYEAAWSNQDTSKTRADARKALVTQRGWTVIAVHWHEGDGTPVDGAI